MALVAASSAACIVANLELPLELSETQLRLLENGRQSAAHETRFVTNSSRRWRAVRHLNPIVSVEIIPEPVVAYLRTTSLCGKGSGPKRSRDANEGLARKGRPADGALHSPITAPSRDQLLQLYSPKASRFHFVVN